MHKSAFPLLKDNKLIYLDSASTTQKPEAVIKRMENFYSSENANVHRSLYPLGARASAAYEDARQTIRRFLNARFEKEIIFTSGATASLNLLAFSFSETLKKGDHILLSEMEHHSNLVPWQIAAKRKGLILDFIPVKSNGRLDLGWMKKNWHEKTALISLTHLSNLLGTVNPVKEVIDFAHSKNVPVALDAAQSTARIPLDVQAIDCDFLVFSGHKIYGPTGIGVLYGKEELLNELPPWQGGGDMISSVSLNHSSWNELPWKFEAGTPNICGVLGLNTALEWVEETGRERIFDHEKELSAYAIEKLNKVKGLKLYGTGDEDQLGVFSFNLSGLHAHDTVQFLSEESLALRAGHHCAQPLIKKLNVTSTVRASLGIYNCHEDIDTLCEALVKTRNYFIKRGAL